MIIDPGNDELAIELLDFILFLGISDGGTVGHDWRHRVAVDENAAVVALSDQPITTRF